MFPCFLTPVLTQLFFQKQPATFLTCFCRGERRKYTWKKSHLNWESNSQPPGHESDTLTTEPPGWGERARLFIPYQTKNKKKYVQGQSFFFSLFFQIYSDAEIFFWTSLKECGKKREDADTCISPFSMFHLQLLSVCFTIYGKRFNHLPHMPILGSSNSAPSKDMMSKLLTNRDTIFWWSRKHCGKRRNCLLRAISSFPTMFSKAVCCWWVKVSIYGVKG